MHWNSFSEFLAMGGYAGYVWGAFGATALLMFLEPVFIIRHRKRSIALLKRQLRAEARPVEEARTPEPPLNEDPP